MTDPSDGRRVPAELQPYLDELVRRTRAVCGPRLTGVYAVGSVALGDYRHGRSDVDVAVVVDPALPAGALRELAAELAHPALPCPATGLELVVYGTDVAGGPAGRAGYLLDLNTGPLLPERASFDPAGATAFWYVVDRAVAHQSGLALLGRPAPEVIAAPTRADVLAALAAAVREHAEGEGHLPDNRVLNGCRAAAYCRTGRWLPKRRAAQETAAAEPAFRALIDAALDSYDRPRAEARPLPPAEVRALLDRVGDLVAQTAAGDAPR
ncbi:aminoglycoside adenylyltransferase domain-containing protein [Streptomyces sp. NRRL B-24484]|uniref:aminoglycoside adenylyltransferase domain-containing protein n=1 Tax=Streptomyces sp. NRRL B-24484 TaxID=1463833 RepID=UPI0004C003CD|nr:aminoglycoside adenylyltransferase domain-containing protein [Streptomyces sp. NRRL B-24484]